MNPFNGKNSEDIDDMIPDTLGVGIEFEERSLLSEGKCKYLTLPVKPSRIVTIDTKTWDGLDSVHIYAYLVFQNLTFMDMETCEEFFLSGDFNLPDDACGVKINVTRKLTKKDFAIDSEFREGGYEVGQFTNKFYTVEQAVRRSRREFQRIFGNKSNGWILKRGVS